MDMIRMTETEVQQGFRALADRARREPVAITTTDGREELVVLSIEEYARLKRRDRRVGLTEDLPEEWVEAVRNAKVPDEFAALDAELK
jgi:PHD/YefM family antitoxin component YafN of YafNO toxin-antitoxin module